SSRKFEMGSSMPPPVNSRAERIFCSMLYWYTGKFGASFVTCWPTNAPMPSMTVNANATTRTTAGSLGNPQLRSSRTAGASKNVRRTARANGRLTKAIRTMLKSGMNSYPLSNRLLLSLPPRDRKQLAPLESVRCESEQILLDADAVLDHVFFPNSGVISAVAVYVDGNVIEMATIGREGCAGVEAFLVPSARLPGFSYKFRVARRSYR